ncbi:hypothetical protein NW768_008050 [Fusarium equiseti]|uniref:Mg2+ transporter zinc transport protein n=1 Tax=Fusarium equiseti TaxID=61235 RepID=A0ABQ8R619_FUSEQ|nr:hypothetical protein NW768_008050 [Fusarium equiseti]
MESSGRTCTYSFGDDGLTATASPSGRLLRMSRHFRGEQFGYCVDHPSIPEPYQVVDRITSFLSSANDSDHNIGFYPDQHSWVSDAKVSADLADDRWPIFEIQRENDLREKETCKIKYSISEGAIYQTFEFSNGRPPMVFMPSLLLRQLEFFDYSNNFNEAEKDDIGYQTHLLNEGKCIKRSHKLGKDDNEHAALFVYAFCNNTALTFEEHQDSIDKANEEDPSIEEQRKKDEAEKQEEVDGEGDDGGEGDAGITCYRVSGGDKVSKPTTVTFVYVLSMETDEVESLPKLPKFTATLDVGNTNTSKARKLTEDPNLDVALKRNLEYILSVCSIPIYPDARDDKEFAIALTCGDIDSHRVATAASFYCFQFLLMALKYFRSPLGHPEHSDPELASCSACYMIERIRKVVEGHLKWVFGEKYRNLASSPSCPHVWVNGKEIKGWKESQWVSSESLIDAPFQLIKAGDYKECDNEWEVPKAAKRAIRAWIEELDPKNKLGCYAFPRDIKEPTHNFYLTDHVLIWRTAKCVESLGYKSELAVNLPQEEGGGVQTSRRPRKREYLPGRIQNQILKRFTTENPASKKRMLSVSRSPGHVRFLFRTRDTSLFHAMDSQLFDKPGAKATEDAWRDKIDIWKNLVDCQSLHEDNEDTSWDEPMRFALSIVMACKGKSINSRSPGEMHKRGMDVLLESKWPNGLFPGQLDVDGEPAVYNDEKKRDGYWGNSFEIPYLLWKYGKYPGEAKTVLPEQYPEPAGPQKALLEYQRNTTGLNYVNLGSMKRTFPWNNVVDQTNIVELSDEWLYDEPDFFKGHEDHLVYDFVYNLVDDIYSSRKGLLFGGAIIDVPRSKAGKQTPPELHEMLKYVRRPNELKEFMMKKRVPDKAKKRFCAIFAANSRASILYPQTYSELESVLSFSWRHQSHDKYFSEETAAEMNRWTTELHLSFNDLERSSEVTSGQSSRAEWTSTATKGLEVFVSLLRDVGCKSLRQVAMSLRFDGDFFDRYWTCYFLDVDTEWVASESDLESNVRSRVHDILYNKGGKGRKISLEDKKEPWRQRRILELLLFQTMVDRVDRYTDRVLSDSESISKEDEIFQAEFDFDVKELVDRGDDSYRRNINFCQKHLREHQQRLQTVDQDMTDNLVQIDLWLKRERERQTERPRWTFNDEIKYRGIISKLLNQNDHTIQDLRRSQSRVRILNEKLGRMLQEFERKVERLDKELEKQDRLLEVERSRQEAKRNADIQRFTYVTVIFLPLGFATGVFSMSGAPAGTTLRNMALTAIGAFVVTGILVVCATNLEKIQEIWGKIKAGKKKPSDKDDGSQSTEEEHMMRGAGGSEHSVGRLRDAEERSRHSEGDREIEAVRGTDNNV